MCPLAHDARGGASVITAPRPRVLFDASNLGVGGGVQVAASLVREFMALAEDPASVSQHPWLTSTTYLVSPEVAENIPAEVHQDRLDIHRSRWSDVDVWLRNSQPSYDLQFTVFGPRYGRRRAPLTLVGIADVTSVYKWPAGVSGGSLSARIKRLVRGYVSRRLFARETVLVSEAPSLARAFCRRVGFPAERVAIIPNVVNRDVADASRRASLEVCVRDCLPEGCTVFAYVTRAYPHKNLGFLAPLRRELRALGIDAHFVLTLTDQEFSGLSPELRAACVNVGPVPVRKVADILIQADAAIFPSLLESFSAAPLEAMATNGLLFASDRPFVRDVCADAAVYFDPLDAHSAARVIASTLKDEEECERRRERAQEFARNLPTSADRAADIACLVSSMLRSSKEGL